ncbi:YitT family protein [Olsenella sp. YH-ols2217]|uniref:YitT family protein n=1 Tax=Kribbibacterium absianum TaxID=3044210 RepID=A0ABT6ZJZ5_9ACTN|nr:YitT family protein [Olsenella sp. YH-ols2217]MDJ1129378.1 YitT family protein [Olsenella sp. YH-ols2217]
MLLICVGSFIFAFGFDAFAVREGLAAGGVTGLATIIYAIGEKFGLYIPVGTQTLVMNVFLMIPVVKSGGLRYAARTIGGIVASSVFLDLLAPVTPNLAGGDLLLAAIWGGALCGIGLGIVFRSGGNTGGVDIIAQLVQRKTGVGVGALSIIMDLIIVTASIPVFSLKNALYAVIFMFLSGVVIDVVIDGPKNDRMAWIITKKETEMRTEILATLGRGCTTVEARGAYSGKRRPMFLVVLSRREVGLLREIVAAVDPRALMVITDAEEAFGEGFRELSDGLR